MPTLSTHPRWRGYPLVLTLLFASVLCTCVRAQDIRLTVIVPNPPPVYWEAYLEFDAEIRVIVTNVGAVPHDLKLVPTLTSDRGLSAAFRPDYQPLAPLTIGPGETTNLSFRDLRALFGTPAESDIALSGISFDRLFASETIPEGSYTLCVEARDFGTNEALSNNFGCAVFFVQQHEPPLIVWPYDGELVPATQPQFLNFLWTATGLPGSTRYRFALYDLDELGLFNRADAFVLEATRPYFEADDLIATNLPYDLALPPLTPGRRYAVQVSAYDPAGELLFAQGGRSAVHQFTYEEQEISIGGEYVTIDNDEGGGQGGGMAGGGGGFQNGDQGQQLVMEACPDLPLPQVNPHNGPLSAGQTVSIGNHALVLNSGGPLPLAGTGRIELASLGVWVNVSFTGLQVNQALEAYGGTVTAVTEGNPNLANLSEAASGQILDQVTANNAWVDGGGGEPLNLPFGLPGAGMNLVVAGMNFGPSGATADLFAAVELPEVTGNQDRRLLLVGEGACFNDENPGQNMDLLLAGDETFPLGAGVTMTFAGGEEGTRLRWNAAGIDWLDVDLSLDFAASAMPGGQALSAHVTAQVEDYQDWIGEVSLSGPALADESGEGVKLTYDLVEAVFDHSVTQNPDGLVLPPTHPDAGNAAVVKGVFISSYQINHTGSDEPVAFSAQNLLIDRDGVWARASLEGNLLDVGEGEIGGWAMGITGVELDIRGSNIHAATFDGRVQLPISDTEVVFTAPLAGGENFSVALELGQELEVDMWLADLELAGNSRVEFAYTGDSYVPTAELHGNISLGWDSVAEAGEDDVGVSQFSLPGVDFENLRIVGGPSPSLTGTFSLDDPAQLQGQMQNFPLQLTDLGLDLSNNGFGLRFGVGLTLMNEANGFHGETVFTIRAKRENGQYSYDETVLNLLSVEAELNLISLSGSIELFDQHDEYGTGFDGQVSVDIEQIGAGLDMRLMVGRAPENYRYFMVDALVKLPDNAGIPVGTTPLAFYGFGGGFWRNMNRQAAMPAVLNYGEIETVDQSDNEPGVGATTTYLPQNGITGFSMKTIIGLQGSKRALNGDLELYLEMEDDFSLDEIVLGGNVYVVQDIADRGDAFIHGQGELRLAPVEQLFTLSCTLSVDFPAGLSTLYQPLDAGFQTGGGLDWWFYLGQWTPGADPITDNTRFKTETQLNFGLGQITSVRNGYFMMGNRMPLGMPGVPEIVSSQFANDGKTLPGQDFNGTENSYNTTNGFAFGMGRYMNLNFNARIFTLDVGYTWGFDLLLADYSNSDCSASDFGLNNWYAAGQAYAHCHIAGSVKGRLFGKTREFKFVELDAAALMQFQGPNPIWIKGNARIRGRALGKLIKFNTQVDFEFGEKVDCRENSGDIFDEIPIVQEVTPRKGMKGRSIFTAPEVSFNFPNEPLAIDEGEGDEVDLKYYGYRILSVRVDTLGKNAEDYGTFYTDGDPTPNYDQEGYAAIFDLPELPPNSKIKFIIEVEGERYDGPLGLTVEETYAAPPGETTFDTGPPPDKIMTGTITHTVPFRRQLYFTKNDHPTGNIRWHRPQYSNLFRDQPTPEDKLDPAGSYNYVARFIRLDNGDFRDRPITYIDHEERLEFPIPTGWLVPEMGYRIRILRLYTAPQDNAPATDTTLVSLELYSGPPNPYVFEGGIQVPDDDPGVGDGQPGNLQLNGGVQQAGYQQMGMTQMQFVNNGGQGNGMQQTLNFSNGPDDPGPDPPFEPEFGFTQIDDNDWGGPNDFVNPGGNLDGLERYSRELKEDARTSATVVKDLWPRGQSPWYFRTSSFNSLNGKLSQLEFENAPIRYRDVKVNADDLYNEPYQFVKVPYVRFRSDEPFDRYETSYHYREFQARDGNQQLGGVYTANYHPAIQVRQPTGQWRDGVYYADRSSGSTNGLFRAPLGDVDDWCEEDFDDPDGPGITTPCSSQGGRNAPLHWFGTHTWDTYMTVVPGNHAWGYDNPPGMNQLGYQDWASTTRYTADKPFGRGYYGRRLEHPLQDYDIHSNPFLELTQWRGGTPPGLEGSGIGSTHTFFNNSNIAAYSGEGEVNPNIGDLPNQFAGQEPPDLEFAQAQPYLVVTDFTEWVTLKDWFGMRAILSRGIDEILDIAENDLDLNPGTPVPGATCEEIILPDCNPNGVGDPIPPGPLPDLDGIRPFSVFYYPQLRRWLMLKDPQPFGTGANDYHQYYVRPAGTYQVRLGTATHEYVLPQLNDNPDLN